jgi:NhaP-type Na+/H+ or K+/H+ antiporter
MREQPGRGGHTSIGRKARLLARLGWHDAFVLGAVVAPSDAVVTLALAHALRLSPRAMNVLEGETLFNDATAFVVYGVASHRLRRAAAKTKAVPTEKPKPGLMPPPVVRCLRGA